MTREVQTMNGTSLVVTAMNEVDSLVETIEGILRILKGNSFEIIIATSRKATNECIETAQNLERRYKGVVTIYFQENPYVAAAILEASHLAKFENIIVMSADGETPYSAIPKMLAALTEHVDIVCTSRWIEENSFTGYGNLKLFLNRGAQKLCRLLYGTKLTDFTFGFRLYRRKWLVELSYFEKKHPFFLESIIVPIRMGADCVEVPVTWKPRAEGDSVITKRDILLYLRPVLRNVVFTRS